MAIEGQGISHTGLILASLHPTPFISNLKQPSLDTMQIHSHIQPSDPSTAYIPTKTTLPHRP
uniref:Uncharacterized protein n=1 Tax=Moniliophthora roreri TaxID=221103 RepID=A0A0W0EUR5_MONRR